MEQRGGGAGGGETEMRALKSDENISQSVYSSSPVGSLNVKFFNGSDATL